MNMIPFVEYSLKVMNYIPLPVLEKKIISKIAIINPNCIKAFFKERISDRKFKSV